MADTAIFEAHRPRLHALCVRLLGGSSEAEDVLQEAAIRWLGVAAVDNPAALLTTITTRLCIDALRAAPRRREVSGLPELPSSHEGPTGFDALRVAESLSAAFLVLLEQLGPVERAVFLLREAFDYDYATIAELVDRSEPNCRQILRRAKGSLRGSRPRFQPSEAATRELARRFFQAVRHGDTTALEELLAEDAALYTDDRGRRVGGLRATGRPVRGRTAVARFAVAVVQALGVQVQREPMALHGQPGVLVRENGVLRAAVVVDVASEVRGVYVLTRPEALRAIANAAVGPN